MFLGLFSYASHLHYYILLRQRVNENGTLWNYKEGNGLANYEALSQNFPGGTMENYGKHE